MTSTFSTYALTGLAPVESNYTRGSMEAGATADHDGLSGILHPDNPLLWVGVILGVTFGLVGVSGSARLGKARVSASLDREK